MKYILDCAEPARELKMTLNSKYIIKTQLQSSNNVKTLG
jgi:hypothetical protein